MVTSLSLSAQPIIKLIYGEPYLAGASSLAILFIGTAGLGMANSIVAIIQGSGQPQIAALIFALLIPVDIVLNLVLIPTMGIRGAAVATSLTFLIGMLASMIPLYHKFSVAISINTVFKIVLAAVLAAITLVKTQTTPNLLPVSLAAGSVVYLASLWVLKELTREDFEFFRNALQGVLKPKMSE
jgi:O-antigen/teichoic acid export membrane protein